MCKVKNEPNTKNHILNLLGRFRGFLNGGNDELFEFFLFEPVKYMNDRKVNILFLLDCFWDFLGVCDDVVFEPFPLESI